MTSFKGIVSIAGPPCSGKTATGLVLSRILDVPFIDLDRKVENRSGNTIPQIFSISGESHFRKLEYECLRDALNLESCVLALGGGCLLDPVNLSLVIERTLPVTLYAEDDILVERCTGTPRPLAPSERILRKLLDTRRKHYLLLPNRIDTGKATPDMVANMIMFLITEKLDQ